MTDEQTKSGVPGGAQSSNPPIPTSEPAEEPEADEQIEAPQASESKISEDEAWKNFPNQVQAAITYAGENKYDYGPKLRNVDIDHTVVSAAAMSDEITRIVLDYRPTTKFKGKSGSEYLDVDADGVIQARRQIRVPKESMPWVLVGLATLSVIAAAVIVPLIVFVEEKIDTKFVAGRTIWVRSTEPRIDPYLTYDSVDTAGTPRKWIIVPEGEGTEIAYVDLTIDNQTSGVVSLAIDTDSVEVTTEDGISARPIDIFERVQWPAEGAELDPRLNVLTLPLWGDFVLGESQRLEGFMAFEVPTGSKIDLLRWSATDTATIRY